MLSSCKFAFNSFAWAPSLADWTLVGQCIQTNECRRISEFCFKDDAKLCLSARLLLRYALCKCLGVKWHDLKLSRTEKGKPILDPVVHNVHKIYFNASHQGDYAAVVAHNEHNVGIDIMDVRVKHGDNDTFFKLMDRQFTPHEWKSIRKPTNAADQMKTFYRHWCLKESYVKALGAGITYDLQSLSFSVSSPLSNTLVSDTHLYVSGNLQQNWVFEESMLDDNHCVTVARNVQTPSQEHLASFKILSFTELMSIAEPMCKTSEVDTKFIESYNKPFKSKRY
ncbi:L-aminoadipate-semialdehyde dehydrogenase-phosphopantetheinyl transferase [Ciona intestinalis]